MHKLIKTAYELALHPTLPLSSFKILVKCQRMNGVRLIDGKDDGKAAGEYIDCIAQAVQEKVAAVLVSKNAMSLLSDGSQARKTGADKEMVLIRVERCGIPTYFVVALLDMARWGGTGAEALKTAIDSIFKEDGQIPMAEEEYVTKLVSCTADGANVNMGELSGLLTRLARDRNWLLKVHCANHRVELAVKHAFKNSKFEKVDEYYQANYNLLKQSGKVASEVKASAEALEIQHYKLTKITGTRFVGHRITALKKLLDMWPAFKIAYENLIASRDTQKIKGKLTGLYDKFKSYKMLCMVSTYLDILEKTRAASKIFESEGLLPFELKPVIEITLSDLDECIEDAGTEREFADSHLSRFRLQDSEEGKVVRSRYLKDGNSKKAPENRQYVTYTFDDLTFATEGSREIASREKKEIATNLKQLLAERFQDANQDLYETMKFIDPESWTDDRDYGNDQLRKFAEHFSCTLSKAGFDSTKAMAEWRSFKKYVKANHRGLKQKVTALWRKVFEYKRDEYPNLCLCAEIILSLSGSNSTVERAFSTLRLLLSDRRLGMRHNRMEQLLTVSSNDKNWSEEERSSIIARSLEIYMEKRQRRKSKTVLAVADDSEPQPAAKKPKRDEQVSGNASDESETESEDEELEEYGSDISNLEY